MNEILEALQNFNSPIWTFIFQRLAWVFIVFWWAYSIYYFIKATKKPEKINIYLFESIPSVFVSIGLLGTFLGITQGLINFNVDPEHIKDSIKILIGSLRFAFLISIAGIGSSLFSSKFVKGILHRYDKIQPPSSPELIELGEINNSLKALKVTLVDNATKQKIDFEHFINEIKTSNRILGEKLDEFATYLAETNTDAIVTGLQNVIEDFNSTFKSFIASLIDKNFKELTDSVNSLNTWQKENKQQIIMLREKYEMLVSDTSKLVKSMENMVVLNDKLVGQNSRLKEILDALGKVLVEDKRFVELVKMLTDTSENLLQLSTGLTATANSVKEVASDNKQMTGTITTWFAGEEGIRASIFDLNHKLSQLEKVKLEDLKLLDTTFNSRLQSTFQSLDELLKQYITYIESRQNGKSKV